jgi:hypothetical protein
MLRRYDGYTTGALETANQIYFTFGLALSISIYALSYNFGVFGQLRGRGVLFRFNGFPFRGC